LTSARRLVAALVAALSLALAGGAMIGAAPAAAASSSFTLGFTDGVFEGSNGTTWLNRAKGAGAQVILLPVEWATVAESKPPAGEATNPAWSGYDWSAVDQAVRNTAAKGFTIAFTVAGAAGGPAWADGPHRPKNAAAGTWKPNATALGQFATALARRYSGHFNPGGGVLPHVRYYQGWSEPNLPNHLSPQWVKVRGHWVAESPVIYRGLLNAFYAGVKAVNRSDVVITGGTAPFGDSPGGSRVPPALFWRTVLCLNDNDVPQKCSDPAHFDILAHHPYEIGGPFFKALDRDDVTVPDMGKLTRALSIAGRTGRALPRGHKQVWVTEFSWDTKPPDPNGVPVLTRAKWMDQAFWELWREGVSTLCWYLIVDQPPVPSYAESYQSGLYYTNGKVKPGLEAYRFPFVVQSIGHGQYQLWGITPRSGTVSVQRKVGGRWVTLYRFNRRAHAIFDRTIGKPPKAAMRALVGPETSMSFTPS
jgi:hypothetical protein